MTGALLTDTGSWRLVQHTRAGTVEDRDAAVAEIYRAYQDQVFRYVRGRVRSRELAEDITAETFVRALRRLDTFEWQGRNLGAWLVTIARNLLADYFKSGGYRLERPGDVTVLESVDQSPEGDPAQQMADQAVREIVRAAVTLLRPEQRRCIELRFMECQSVAATAAVMGKREGAIKALQYRAVASLRRLLQDSEL